MKPPTIIVIGYTAGLDWRHALAACLQELRTFSSSSLLPWCPCLFSSLLRASISGSLFKSHAACSADRISWNIVLSILERSSAWWEGTKAVPYQGIVMNDLHPGRLLAYHRVQLADSVWLDRTNAKPSSILANAGSSAATHALVTQSLTYQLAADRHVLLDITLLQSQ
jgi:hypothetical protein